MRLSDCKIESPLSTYESTEFAITSQGPLNSKAWFHTKPLSVIDISRIWGMQLFTMSTNQGWISNPNSGCWSWFEVAIYRRKPPPGENAEWMLTRPDFSIRLGNEEYVVRCRLNGEPLSWLSHRNEEYRREVRIYDGRVFGSDHELWSFLSPGDCIVVLAFCQFPGWSCKGGEALLRFWEYFEPQRSYDL
jgi:hypothetical protein